MKKCEAETEVFSRIVGYYTPVKHWNPGKKAEFVVRKTFDLQKSDTEKKEMSGGRSKKG